MSNQQLARLHQETVEARDRLNEAAARLHKAVAAVLDAGGSPSKIASDLGVSRARVYQWRDKAHR